MGHVFALRERLQDEIRRARPSVVCIELDRLRLNMLLEERERRARGEQRARATLDWRMIGRGGLIFAFIAWTQARLARKFGSSVGDEMLAALDVAREVGAPARLIDMDTAVFTRNWMARLTRRERTRLFLSAFAGMFASRKRVEKELKEYFEDEDAFVRELAEAFPLTKAALIDERNAYMARGIERAKTEGPVVVAVVGAGHIAGIREELLKGGQKAEDVQVITLEELQRQGEGAAGAPTPGSAGGAPGAPGAPPLPPR